MPTWWIIGAAIYALLVIWAIDRLVMRDEFTMGEGLFGGSAFIAVGVASGFFWFG